MTTVNIHASCVACAGAGAPFGVSENAGVLLLGKSGSGKSDLALRLIAMGAKLVSDDRCEIFSDGDAILARPPRNIEGLMEIRGLGIVAVPFAPEARIALVVQAAQPAASARLPERRRYEPPAILSLPQNMRPPEIALDMHAPSAPAKILAAVAAFENQMFREDVPP
jgi:HPr kinase/phosphorylase